MQIKNIPITEIHQLILQNNLSEILTLILVLTDIDKQRQMDANICKLTVTF